MIRNNVRFAAWLALLAVFALVSTGRGDAILAKIVEAAGLQPVEYVSHAAAAAIVVDAGDGKPLYEFNSREKMYPASTTKIMTAFIALENGSLEEIVRVGAEIRGVAADESNAGLREGDVMTLRDLLSALMLPSGNDAARTIARYISERVYGSADDWNERFAELMNEKAERLGAVGTHFANPHGMHDPEHYSTAADLALIALEAMKLPAFREIVAAPYVDAGSEAAAVYVNRNKLLDRDGDLFYRGANGIKTGFTSAAGYCLVASAERGGRELIAVVLQSTEDAVWSDARSLLEFGFQKEEPAPG